MGILAIAKSVRKEGSDGCRVLGLNTGSRLALAQGLRSELH
jgi:hypothetical protein